MLACSSFRVDSKPGVGRIWPFSVSCYLSPGFSSKLVQSLFIGNSKAAAHIACRPSVLVTTKPEMNE